MKAQAKLAVPTSKKPKKHNVNKKHPSNATKATAVIDREISNMNQLENGITKKESVLSSDDGTEDDISWSSEDEVSDVDIADLLNANSSDDDFSLDHSQDEIEENDDIKVDYYDTSDEELINDTVGKISLEWYNDHPHIGYDIEGNKILKPATPDQLEKLLDRFDNTSRTIHDAEGRHPPISLTDDQLSVVQSMVSGKFPDTQYNPYEPTIEWFTHDPLPTPLSAAPEPKSRFIPSKSEHKLVMRVVRAIRAGFIQVLPPGTKASTALPTPWKDRFHALWKPMTADEEAMASALHHGPRGIQAPKMTLPDTSESYNPPEEYVPTEEERTVWENAHPDDRSRSYLPRKYTSLRLVPAYAGFIKERFERCLDLYLCPRTIKMRMDVDPESLIPTLPSPESLQPFPTKIAIRYGAKGGPMVRCLSVDATGQYLATADDSALHIYEINTARCLKTIPLSVRERVHALAFNPHPNYASMLAVCYDRTTDIMCISDIARDIEVIQLWIETGKSSDKTTPNNGGSGSVLTWQYPDTHLGVTLVHSHPVTSLAWHRRGDYLATVAPEAAGNRVILIHQVSKGTSYAPFRKWQGTATKVVFHPSKPVLFVATEKYVRGYHLQENKPLAKLNTGVQHVSALDIHPLGDHLLVGSHDRRVCWFDMDISTRPYKMLKYHTMPVRQVIFHKHYPLFASCSDDGHLHIFHGKVFSDLTQNPLIVPVKILKNDQGVAPLTDCQFHPYQPWIFASDQKGRVLLYT